MRESPPRPRSPHRFRRRRPGIRTCLSITTRAKACIRPETTSAVAHEQAGTSGPGGGEGQMDTKKARTSSLCKQSVCALLLVMLTSAVEAQWLTWPTVRVPRAADGKPNLDAPAPQMANGRPDLSGIWAMEHDHHAPTNGLGCEPPSPEFLNIAASVREGLPFQPWAAELVKARRSDTRRISPVTQGSPSASC
jgi:hypothetical protein